MLRNQCKMVNDQLSISNGKKIQVEYLLLRNFNKYFSMLIDHC